MNAKNIKKSLNAKLNHWLKHIDDENIKEVIKDNAIITGGAIVSLLTGEKPNDYDVYFKTKEACETVANYYVSKFNETHGSHAQVKVEDDRIKVFIKSSGIEEEEPGDDDETEPFEPFSVSIEESVEEPDGAMEQLVELYDNLYSKSKPQEQNVAEKPKYRPVFLSTNAISLSDDIQIVIRFYGSPEEIHQNYDFIHCVCWYSFYDNKLSLPAKAMEAIINKELYYIGSKYPLCSIIRTRKFINRGWTINAGQYLKMALQLNELDLHDLKVFEDQLVGVDSLYFAQAINAIKERQEKEPDFKIDNAYLFEVINRIF